MAKIFLIALVSVCLLFPCYTLAQTTYQVPPQRVGVGLGFSIQEDITNLGGTLYYGLTPTVTGRVFGNLRFVDEGSELRALGVELPPWPGGGVGLSIRDFPNRSNAGYWGSAYAAIRFADMNERLTNITIASAEATSVGLGGGVIVKIQPQPTYMLYPLAGLLYETIHVSWDSPYTYIPDMSDSGFVGIVGLEVVFAQVALSGTLTFSMEGGGSDFVFSSYFRP